MVEELLFQEDYQIVDLILIAIALLVAMAVAIILFFYFSRKRIIKSELEKAHLKIANQKPEYLLNLLKKQAYCNQIYSSHLKNRFLRSLKSIFDTSFLQLNYWQN